MDMKIIGPDLVLRVRLAPTDTPHVVNTPAEVTSGAKAHERVNRSEAMKFESAGEVPTIDPIRVHSNHYSTVR